MLNVYRVMALMLLAFASVGCAVVARAKHESAMSNCDQAHLRITTAHADCSERAVRAAGSSLRYADVHLAAVADRRTVAEAWEERKISSSQATAEMARIDVYYNQIIAQRRSMSDSADGAQMGGFGQLLQGYGAWQGTFK